MKTLLVAGLVSLVGTSVADALQIDYAALWDQATPFHEFLENVRARREQWQTRFSNAAIEAGALTEARALPGRRRILAVAVDRCSDSAWALPYIAKLAAAVPEKLELRVIRPATARGVQAAHPTPDGRHATPTVVILDERNELVGSWVERPAELQKWFIEKKPTLSSDELHAEMDVWYAADAGRSTLREVLTILGRPSAEREGE